MTFEDLFGETHPLAPSMPLYKGLFLVGFSGFEVFHRAGHFQRVRHGEIGRGPDIIILNSRGRGILAVTEAVELAKRFGCWTYIASIGEDERTFWGMEVASKNAARSGHQIELLGVDPDAMVHHASVLERGRLPATLDVTFDEPFKPTPLVDGYRLALMSEQEPDFGCHYYALPEAATDGVVPMPGAMPMFCLIGEP